MYNLKIFFTASFEGKEKYQSNYDKIVQIIKESKAEVVATELANYKKLLTLRDIKKLKTEKEIHYYAIKKGIQWADLVIMELSQESFQVGHEATLAIQLKKPLLGLSIHQDWSQRILDTYFIGAKYNEYNVREIITGFINKYSKNRLTERFNMFLSKQQIKKLDSLAKENSTTRSELIRSLIEKA